MNNIILIGMPGCGKSTIGKLISAQLGYTFRDLDDLIQARQNATLQQIIDKIGPEGFLQMEADIICSIHCWHHVLSPGGSAVCLSRAAGHLRKLGTVVYLRVPVQELESRIRNFSSRGIVLATGQSLGDLIAIRAPHYEATAHHIVDCPVGETAEETAARVLSILNVSASGRPAPFDRADREEGAPVPPSAGQSGS